MADILLAELKVKGDSFRNPRMVGDNLVMDAVVTNIATGVETVTPVTVGNTRGPGWTEAEMVAAVGVSFYRGQTPPPSPTKFGYPVEWIDTREPSAWPAPAPIRDDATLKITIPDDEGATYRVGGVDKAPGTYTVTIGTTWAVSAHAKSGYTLAGVTAWTINVTGITGFPNLDALIVADAPTNFLKLNGGSLTDIGSAPLTWTATGATVDSWGLAINNGGITSSTAAGIGISGGISSWSVEAMVDFVPHSSARNMPLGIVTQQGALEFSVVGWQGSASARGVLAEYNSFCGPINMPHGTYSADLTHIALTCGGGVMRLYRNGVEIGTASGYTTSATVTQPIRVAQTTLEYGQVGRVAVYRNKTLTAARVLQHAQAAGVA